MSPTIKERIEAINTLMASLENRIEAIRDECGTIGHEERVLDWDDEGDGLPGWETVECVECGWYETRRRK